MGTEDIYWDNFMPLVLDRIVRGMRNDINAEVQEFGITSAQAPYLLSLYIKNGQTMASLSHFLEMDRANTSRVIKSLEVLGMVRFERSTDNARNVPILLTGYGLSVAGGLLDRMTVMNRDFFKGVSEEDYIRVRNTLIRVFRNLHGMGEEDIQTVSFYKDLGVESSFRSETMNMHDGASRKLSKI